MWGSSPQEVPRASLCLRGSSWIGLSSWMPCNSEYSVILLLSLVSGMRALKGRFLTPGLSKFGVCSGPTLSLLLPLVLPSVRDGPFAQPQGVRGLLDLIPSFSSGFSCKAVPQSPDYARPVPRLLPSRTSPTPRESVLVVRWPQLGSGGIYGNLWGLFV